MICQLYKLLCITELNVPQDFLKHTFSGSLLTEWLDLLCNAWQMTFKRNQNQTPIAVEKHSLPLTYKHCRALVTVIIEILFKLMLHSVNFYMFTCAGIHKIISNRIMRESKQLQNAKQ